MEQETKQDKSVMDSYQPGEFDKVLEELVTQSEGLEPVDVLGMLGGTGVVGKALLAASLMTQSGKAEAGIADIAYKLHRFGLEEKAKELLKMGDMPAKRPDTSAFRDMEDMFPNAAYGKKSVFPGTSMKEIDTLMNNSAKHIVTAARREKEAAKSAPTQMELFQSNIMPILNALVKAK